MKKRITLIIALILLNISLFSMPKGFGTHFNNWLNSHGYKGAFPFSGVGGGDNSQQAKRDPVIFVHGNGSMCWGQFGDTKGWRTVYAYLKAKGWKKEELYAVNWQDKAFTMSAYNNHSRMRVSIVKNFIKAVAAYTGRRVAVIAHSMGVTLARRAMLVGNLYSKVKTFIAIAGANHGLRHCTYRFFGQLKCKIVPTCLPDKGLCPIPGSFVTRLNSAGDGDNEMQGKPTRTYVMRSRGDQICVPFYTPLLKGAHKVLTFKNYSHWELKNRTGKYQYNCLMWKY